MIEFCLFALCTRMCSDKDSHSGPMTMFLFLIKLFYEIEKSVHTKNEPYFFAEIVPLLLKRNRISLQMEKASFDN